MKRQPEEWEKVFANHIFDKGPALRMYKELSQLNLKKTNTFYKYFLQTVKRQIIPLKMGEIYE